MDPASGTFTSMDTYAGSLSDPMSLHKYLFANSNPVMYSDPSGNSTGTITDSLSVCAIIMILAVPILSVVSSICKNTNTTNSSNQVSTLLNRLFSKLTKLMIFKSLSRAVIQAIILYVNSLVKQSGKSVVNWDKWDEEYDDSLPKKVSITPPGNFHNMRRRNKDADKQWKEAIRRATKLLGHPISQEIQDRVHKEIHKNDLNIDEIVKRILAFYGK